MMMVVPFYSNTEDDTHCFQAVLKMVLKHFIPEKDFGFEELDRLSDKVEGKWTWPTRAMINLQKMNFHVWYISTFDWEKFSDLGTKYLEERSGAEVAAKQEKNSNIEKEMADANELLLTITPKTRIPILEDIKKLLDIGYLVICNVNYYVLKNEPGYSGHFVLIYKIDDKKVYMHDPGLPPIRDHEIDTDVFEKAWAYPAEQNKNLIGVRLKSDFKIFGVGLSKTGTTSLTHALKELGYCAVHNPENLEIIDIADAATDISVANKFEFLDKKYPNSKFIVTKINLISWLVSMYKHYKRGLVEKRSDFTLYNRILTYGTVEFNVMKLSLAYLKHYAKIKRYFKNRPEDLLEMNITSGDGWNKLCKFLNKDVPNKPFPIKNIAPKSSKGIQT